MLSILPGMQREILFRNYGKTPAILTQMVSRFWYWPQEPLPIPDDKTDEFPDAIAASAGGELGPFPIFLKATAPEITDAKAGRGALFVVARLRYVDIFDRPHETGICWQYVITENRFIPFYGTHKLNYHT